MDHTSYLERWAWVGLTLVVFALQSPSAVLVGLALWLWLHWKPRGWWRWVVAGLLLLDSWAGLVLLWDTRAAQIIALREAITQYTEVPSLLIRALPVWSEGTLLGPTSKHAPFAIGYAFESKPHDYLPDVVGTRSEGTVAMRETSL